MLTFCHPDNPNKLCTIALYSVQRQKHYKHRTKAKSNPKKYSTIIIDGMDQPKLLLPQFCYNSKAFADAWKLKTHLTGILDLGNQPTVIIDLFQWPHGSTFRINAFAAAISLPISPTRCLLTIYMYGYEFWCRVKFCLSFMLFAVKITELGLQLGKKL